MKDILFAFLDRNYNRLFNRKNTIKLNIDGLFDHLLNIIVYDGALKYRSVGKGFFVYKEPPPNRIRDMMVEKHRVIKENPRPIFKHRYEYYER